MPQFFSFILLIILFVSVLLILYPNPFLLDLLVWMGLQAKAAGMVYTRFNRPAPVDERSVKGKYFKKLDASGASMFLFRCRPVTIAAIFYQWYSGESAKGVPPKIVNKWIKEFQSDEQKMKKIVMFSEVILRSENKLFSHLLAEMDVKQSLILLREVNHGKIPRTMETLPPDAAIHLLSLLSIEDGERVKDIVGKMTAEYAAKIRKHKAGIEP